MIISMAGVLIGLLVVAIGVYPLSTPVSNAAVSAGTVDFSFFYPAQGTTAPDLVQAPTAAKPQSKLWYNDGRWWGSLFNNTAGAYHIYWLDQASQKWIDSGTPIDTRPQTMADTLWDGTHLYIASGGIVTTTATLDGLLFRYTYNPASKTYIPVPGSPVTIRSGGADAIVIDKDGAGHLWAVFIQNKHVMVTHSLASDGAWVTPYALAVTGAAVANSDIASLIAFDGKIGVLWSNVLASTFYFATHVDGTDDTAASWVGSIAASQPGIANNQINMKALANDPSGNIFAVVKNKLTTPANPATDPQIELLVGKRLPNGTLAWTTYPVSDIAENQTRPIVEIDAEHRQLYVFSSTLDGGAVYGKSTSLDSIQFDPTTKGQLLIRNTAFPYIDNVTSTKQSLSSATGLVVLASFDNTGLGFPGSPATDYYFHANVDLGAPLPTPTGSPTATPTVTPTPAGANGSVSRYLPLIQR
jgi:hypothetical protein